MSDDKLSEKMIKLLTNFFKKTDFFEKIQKSVNKTSSIVIGIGIFSTICLGSNLIFFYKINKKINDKINNNDNKYNLLNTSMDHILFKIQCLEYITENNYFKDTILFSKKYVHKNIQTEIPDDSKNNENNNSNESLNYMFKIPEETVNEIAKSLVDNNNKMYLDDYDELSNECYDMIPCNNVKKLIPNKSLGDNIVESYYS